MLTLSLACSRSSKGFTQLLPNGSCSISQSCPPAGIHLPLGLLLEAFPDSPFPSMFTLRCVCTEG